jgi:threonine synthase
MRLVCTGCGRSLAPAPFVHPCATCGEPVEVRYEPGEIHPHLALAGGGRRHGILTDFAAVLPGIGADLVSIGEGSTPLLELPHLSARLGLPAVHIKNEGANPTGTFKDRGSAVAISWALGHGFHYVGTVSSGNMAGSVAAYAARAALPCLALVPSRLRAERVFMIGVYGPELVSVDGDYGDLYRAALRLGRERGIYFAVSDDPWRIEGQKTIAYELLRDLGRVPDFVFLATSSGGHFAAVLKGFCELREAGLIDRLPALVGVQSAGCAPIARAFAAGKMTLTPWLRPTTTAGSIANPDPPSGNRVLRSLAAAGAGAVIEVDDEDMRRAQRLLAAGEGVFVQMESAAALAGALVMARAGRIGPAHTVVLLGTGNGLKDPGAFHGQDFARREVSLADVSGIRPPGASDMHRMH